MAPTLASPTVDVFVDTLAAAAAPVGTPAFAAVAPGEVRAYVHRRSRVVAGAVPALNYRSAIVATATLAPFIQADVPNGTTGTATSNPLAGDLVAGTAITIVITPASVVGSTAPQTAAFLVPTALFLIDRQPPRTAP